MKLCGALLGVLIGIAAFSLFPPPKAVAILATSLFCYAGICVMLVPEKATAGRIATRVRPLRHP